MRRAEQNAVHRSMLFTKLAALEQTGITWDRVFELVAQDSPAIYRDKLLQLATAVRAGKQPIAELLRRSELFLPWEMSIMLIGLGVGKSHSVNQRLSQHYALLARAWDTFRSQLLAPLAMLILSSFLAPWAQMQSHPLSLPAYLLQALAPPLIVLGLLWFGLRQIHTLQAGFQYALLPRYLVWPPIFRSLSVSNSLYHYLMNLALCIEAGLPLQQSLQLGTKAESDPYLRDRYQKVATEVQAGRSLSAAFKSSHLLDETRLVAFTKTGEATGTLESAQARIAEIVKASFEEQLIFLCRWLPRGLYLLIPFTWLH